MSLLPALRVASVPTLTPFLSAVQSWAQSLLDLLPPFVLAVPKKKTSHSRKAMRSANKGLKDKQSAFVLIVLSGLKLTVTGRHCELPCVWIAEACASFVCWVLLESESWMEDGQGRGPVDQWTVTVTLMYCVMVHDVTCFLFAPQTTPTRPITHRRRRRRRWSVRRRRARL
jgi:hypothetical protein